MDLETMIAEVLPEGSILSKNNHNYFSFYIDDREFEDGRDFLTQGMNEKFNDFIERLIKALMKREENDDEPLVSIDFAINGGNID